MSNIKAPFNFVPFDSKKVFYPNWADQISQDVPFEGGLSGSFTLNIEAHSPIFVRNGNLEGKNIPENEKDNSFSNHIEKHFIPGTSIKGMLRSVFEILSFSKMSIYNDDKYAVRDLSNRELYMNRMVPQDKKGAKFIRCGWLEKTEEHGKDHYKIKDCDMPDKISFQNIDKMFGTNMSGFFQTSGSYDANNENHKAAAFKYGKFAGVNAAKKAYFIKRDGREWRKAEEGEAIKGIIVFTGQPGIRTPPQGNQKGRGKGSEFIFWERANAVTHTVQESVIKNFKFAYFAHDEKRQSIDWKYWMEKLKNKERIPVFFQLDSKTKNVIHLGLSYLYKLPYDNSIGDYVRDQDLKKMDLAECLFGRVEAEIGEDTKKKKVGDIRKGRIHVGHAFANQGTVRELPLRDQDVLSSPKASFYPIYARQNIVGGRVNVYKTFMDSGDVLAGRKRYPIHKDGVQSNPAPIIKGKVNQKIGTSFKPLDKGASFQCKIFYHNLKKVELGALLSAITFHNTEGCFHGLGMAKPLGYGKAKILVEGIPKEEQIEAMTSFEELMNAFKDSWAKSSQLTELVTMATEQENQGSSELRYMDLAGFRESKNNKEALDKYSKLGNVKEKNIESLSQKKSEGIATAVYFNDLIDSLQEINMNCAEILKTKNKTETTEKKEVKNNNDDVKEDVTTTPQFLQKGTLNPKKRYTMQGIVSKSGKPNFATIYVVEGKKQENVKLDGINNPIEVGTIVLLEVDVNAKGDVVQASFKGVKKM